MGSTILRPAADVPTDSQACPGRRDEKVPWITGKENEKHSLRQQNKKENCYGISHEAYPECHSRFRPGALFHSSVPGSLTVEAALVLPVFLFAMVMILFLFRIMQIQYIVENSLDKAVAEVSLMDEISEKAAENMTKAVFYKELAVQNCPVSHIQLGIAGFSWKQTRVDKRVIDAQIRYSVPFPLRFFGKKSIELRDSCRMVRWIGNQESNSGNQEQEWVYVTPREQVFHTSRTCTHLKLSVMAVSSDRLNTDWNTCSACGHCARGKKPGAVVYVTREGESYHLKVNCSGLKRTVYMIPKEQTGGKRPCTRCGGK